ncbi:hypothetical protein [Nocardioides sp. Soil805]|uniref:hypothetical protein n=1 Tax=Nocardioides sp. Soil805 TaxID=1736416 RepID=UPI000702C902|nr:hypothetical protein [Nocardioides sp. Soil805]KRF36102.1 hypothetical protein ASG94_01020 [Nocardioides sp. Soil805]
MVLAIVRVWVALALMVSGGLMYAASWQRWVGACPWDGDQDTPACWTRMDHLYDFLAPSEPWTPAGDAAQLAGSSLLVLALALVPLPWALTGRRPGPGSAVGLLLTVLAVVAVGLATLRSGLAGEVVRPVADDLVMWLWFLVPPVLFGRIAVLSPGWAARAAAVLLVLASPLVAGFTYAIGPFDAQPWWEAISGVLTVLASACVLVEAVRRVVRTRDVVREPAGVG